MWKAEAYKMPSWWRELMVVPGVENREDLAWEVWASFQLPKRASELHEVENYHQAPPALPCLLWKNFLPPSNSIFACQDIQEMQHEKTVAYAQALKFLVEKVDLPTGGRPCLLVESVKELWEEMRCYLSFLDEEAFKGMVLPEETSAIPTEEANPQSAETTPAGTPEEEATTGMAREPAAEKRPPNKFSGWEKVLHPSWPMVAADQIPCLSRGPRLRFCNWEERMVQIPWVELMKVTTTPQETPLPTQELEVIQQATLPSSFLGVTVCLRRDQSLEGAHEVTPDPLAVGVMSAPGVVTMSTSHIMKDEVTGVTYMDMETTSVGRVALNRKPQPRGPRYKT